ncbi:hypothetical protein Huta_2929 [Halorhabdus utahensis DSM 12940]|uniref:Uncharacterized protein n=1 Tax=Halorhabdus utahensis (strain DSM 12940 / JCM 11049 / AX-2) TaxID=519442 RepID=C7NRX6_HALUD|nr:hypothetical protein [Halorhabdus utahensis]ACV13090.1 hypothetical protein Huta_2929 [Halorhabdus utahensis DSM 12940]
MSVPSGLQKRYEQYQQLEGYLEEHTPIQWLVLVAIPGGTYAVAHMLISSGSLTDAIALGLVFGVVFATLKVLFQRTSR